ncbi:MAG TPA: biotin/lipoyl-containing protein [Pyrinomonadaceae bacterium]|nr:biotin/lipoyl-containing protein [Pyrinomonadaceae bacterium]
MKLKAQLTDSEHEISLDFDNGQALAEVDSRRYEVELRELADGQYLLINGTRLYRCRVEAKRDSQNSFEVVFSGRARDVTIVDPKRLRSTHSASAHHAGAAQIVSPMPGKIVRVLVDVGAEVEAGDGIVVVEAMKMQNEMKAPKAGVVVSINAATGATVNAGDVLAVIN